ncbi:MAG: DUF4301 family protein [Ignavibacteriaceae bacterium]|nr:DUF4301 family protein [Ignavibacteriaceae bacterium]
MNNKELEDLKKEILAEPELLLSPDEIIEQIKYFEKGIPFLKLVRPCTFGDGVKIVTKVDQDEYIKNFLSALDEGRVVKFVPASGAATRMFKKQLAMLTSFESIELDTIKDLADKGDDNCNAALKFYNNIHRFAFFNELKKAVKKNGKNVDELISNGNISEIIRFVIDAAGLNYSNLPKGCILFHSYIEGSRTAFEEHLVEGMNYSAGEDKVVRVHFTISQEHEEEIKKLFESLFQKYSKGGWKFDIGFSFQSPSTDTISVTMNNNPFRDENGKMVFRPGGHGALLKNLNGLKADIICIKNIDNIVPDHLRDETYIHKKILGGYLISLQYKVFNILKMLEKENADGSLITSTLNFIKDEFEIDLRDKLKEKLLEEKQQYLFNFLNRPIRVCGMVKREDHPGGSPFWVKGENGEITKQIVETAQVDVVDPNQFKIFNEGTHFNPVDIACGVKDYKGDQFNLEKFSNPETGLITQKSKEGKELKALELPGLWNGGMYFWLTVFVEVPKITFNPVKEVNDLLKPEHQPLE